MPEHSDITPLVASFVHDFKTPRGIIEELCLPWIEIGPTAEYESLSQCNENEYRAVR